MRHVAPEHGRGPGRRRHRRPGRFHCGQLHARLQPRAGGHVAARHGGLQRGRQDRRRPARGQEPRGRLLAAQARGVRPRLPQDPACRVRERRHGRGGEVRHHVRRRALLLAGVAPRRAGAPRGGALHLHQARRGAGRRARGRAAQAAQPGPHRWALHRASERLWRHARPCRGGRYRHYGARVRRERPVRRRGRRAHRAHAHGARASLRHHALGARDRPGGPARQEARGRPDRRRGRARHRALRGAARRHGPLRADDGAGLRQAGCRARGRRRASHRPRRRCRQARQDRHGRPPAPVGHDRRDLVEERGAPHAHLRGPLPGPLRHQVHHHEQGHRGHRLMPARPGCLHHEARRPHPCGPHRARRACGGAGGA